MDSDSAALLGAAKGSTEFITEVYIDQSIKTNNLAMLKIKVAHTVRTLAFLETLCQKVSRESACYVDPNLVSLGYTFRNGEVEYVRDDSLPYEFSKIKLLDKSFRFFITMKTIAKAKKAPSNNVICIPGIQSFFNLRGKSVGMIAVSKKRWVVLSNFDLLLYETRGDRTPNLILPLAQCHIVFNINKLSFDVYVVGEDKPYSFQADSPQDDPEGIWEKTLEDEIENARESLFAAMKIRNNQKEKSGYLLCRRLNQPNAERVLLWVSLKAPSLRLSTAIPSSETDNSKTVEVIDLVRASTDFISQINTGGPGGASHTIVPASATNVVTSGVSAAVASGVSAVANAASNLLNDASRRRSSSNNHVAPPLNRGQSLALFESGHDNISIQMQSSSNTSSSKFATVGSSSSAAAAAAAAADADVSVTSSQDIVNQSGLIQAQSGTNRTFIVTTPSQQYLMRAQTAQHALKWVALIRHVTHELKAGGEIFFEGPLKEVDFDKLVRKKQVAFTKEFWGTVQDKKFSKFKSAKDMQEKKAIESGPLGGVSITVGSMTTLAATLPELANIFIIKRKTIEAYAAPDADTCLQWVEAIKGAAQQAKLSRKPVLHEGYLFLVDELDKANLTQPRYAVLMGDAKDDRKTKQRVLCVYNSHIEQHFGSPNLMMSIKDVIIQDTSAWGDCTFTLRANNQFYTFLSPSDSELKKWVNLIAGGSAVVEPPSSPFGLIVSKEASTANLNASSTSLPSSTSSTSLSPSTTTSSSASASTAAVTSASSSKLDDGKSSLSKKTGSRDSRRLDILKQAGRAGEVDLDDTSTQTVPEGLERRASAKGRDKVAEARKAGQMIEPQIYDNTATEDDPDFVDPYLDPHGPQVRRVRDANQAVKVGNDLTMLRPVRDSGMDVGNNAVIVVDNGSAFIKAGYANEAMPSVVFNTAYPNAWKMKTRLPWVTSDSPISPSRKGNIDWDTLIHIWEGLFQKHLNYDTTTGPMLMTEPIGLMPKDRERMIEILFEQFEVPYLSMKSQSLMAALGVSSRFDETACVVSWGNRLDIVPVVHGCILSHATQQLPVGGDDLTNLMGQLLVNEHELVLDNRYILADMRRMKEQHGFVSENLDNSIMQVTTDRESIEKIYQLHDGRQLSLAPERFIVPEALFDPSLLQMDIQGVHDLVIQSINKCAIDLRKSLYGNIVLAGSTTLFPGFGERLQKEVEKKMPLWEKEGVRVVSESNRKYLSWIGGSVFASQPKFEDHCQWLSDWFEYGADIMNNF